MRIALLSGANKNAGDFLIVKRAKDILRACVEECEIDEYDRNKPLDQCIDAINAADCVVFAGGPGYKPDMYPGQFPLVSDLRQLKPPMFALGMGGYSKSSQVSNYSLNPEARKLMDRLKSDAFGFGCRDLMSVSILDSWGYGDSAVMTGCAAWYDLERLNMLGFYNGGLHDIPRRIAISDPADMANAALVKDFVRSLNMSFPDAEFVFVFHRGWNADEYSGTRSAHIYSNLKAWLERRGIECRDISYSADGFSIYDECDLHVGFRVHAHLYNLSRRHPSYLVEEDGRGFGANEVLGMEHFTILPIGSLLHKAIVAAALANVSLPTYKRRVVPVMRSYTEYVASEVARGCPSNLNAFRKMVETYPVMRGHVERINQLG